MYIQPQGERENIPLGREGVFLPSPIASKSTLHPAPRPVRPCPASGSITDKWEDGTQIRPRVVGEGERETTNMHER